MDTKKQKFNIQASAMDPATEYKKELQRLLQNKAFTYIIAAYVVLTMLLLYFFFDRFDIPGTAIGLLPIIPVLGLFHNNFHKQWKENLPKFLTVRYRFEGITRIEVTAIPLQGITDVRAQAQTISTIFLKPKQYFSIKPMLSEARNPEVKIDKSGIINNGEPFVLHEVVLDLLEDIVAGTEDIDSKLLPDVKIHVPALLENKNACLCLQPDKNPENNFSLKTNLFVVNN